MRKILITFLITLAAAQLIAQEKIGITGVIDWEAMQIKSTVTLELASAGVKLPTGRTHAESLVQNGYTQLVRQGVYKLQVDSSTTIKDLVEKGGLTTAELDVILRKSASLPPYLSGDLLNMSASYAIPVTLINNSLQRHLRPSPSPAALNPVSTANYTGIIIIASEKLPAHGMKSSFLPVPCFFPKIWDSEMNLIYEHNMTQRETPMIRYSTPQNILYNTPSGLSDELQAIAGERPLRIFARGVFGITPTDLIIDRADAMQIISSEQNRSLLTQGKVVIILNESVLRTEFSY